MLQRFSTLSCKRERRDDSSLLSKAVTLERKAYGSTQLQLQLSEQIKKQFPEAVVDNHTVLENTVFINKQMLDAIISSIIVLFHNEFTQNGLYVNFGYTNKFIISIISKNATSEVDYRNSSMTIFDAKKVYIRNIVEKIYDLCLITLQILDKNGNLVVCFSFEE